MVANFSGSTGNLTNSSKSNPCPVCGRTKDGDCRISRDGMMVLCHQNFDHAKTQQPDVWHFDGTSSDNRCGVYVFKEPTTKSIRPKQTRCWEYPARDGSRLVRVCRVDDGKGKKDFWQERWDKEAKKWVKGLGEKDNPNKINRADIPIYRYVDIQKAKAKGETIFKVEGETCADLLWKLGLAATTNIGGSDNFTDSDAQDLEGAKVLVISPDRDIKGLKHAEEVEKYFPDALWLYPFPNSKAWNNLPEKNGLDLVDWMEHEKLSAEDIKAAIGEKKVLTEPKKPETNTLSMLEAAANEARKILQSELDELTTNIKLEELRQAVGVSDNVWENKIIKAVKKGLDLQRYKSELLYIMAIADPIERDLRISQIAPKYQLQRSVIERNMVQMKERTTTPEPRLWSLSEAFNLKSEGLQWIVPELLPRNETIIVSGSPKAGKSLIGTDLAFCVATGEERFLGQDIKQGKVLLISVDESLQSTVSKLRKRGFREQDEGNIKILPNWDITQTELLEEWVKDYRPDVVIIDCLKRICKGSVISENSSDFSDNIYTLKEILTRQGASGVLIHHSNKNSEALGVDRLRGSSAIAGSVWGVWQLDHIPKKDPNNSKKQIIDPNDPRRILSCFPRDAEGQRLDIELNLENNSWRCHGPAGEETEAKQEKQTIRERLLRTLEKNQRALSGAEIIELAELKERSASAYSELNRMVNKKTISAQPAPGNKRYTLYSLPNCKSDIENLEFPTPPPPSVSLPNAICESENNIQYGFQIHSKHIAIDSTVTVQSELLSTANDYESCVPGIDSKLPLSQGGGGVGNLDTQTAPAIVEDIREAIATIDRAAALKASQEIKNSKTQKEEVKAHLTPEENLNFRLLLNTGWLKGTRVKYIGSKFAEQLAGLELTIDDLRYGNGITCTKPDGSYTADFDKEDLERIEQPQVRS